MVLAIYEVGFDYGFSISSCRSSLVGWHRRPWVRRVVGQGGCGYREGDGCLWWIKLGTGVGIAKSGIKWLLNEFGVCTRKLIN